MKKAILAGVMMAFVAVPALAQTEGAAVQAASTAAAPSSNLPAAAEAAVSARQVLTNSAGVRLGRIVRANEDGGVRIIFDGRVVSIPASSLSVDGDRLVTSLSRTEVFRLSR